MCESVKWTLRASTQKEYSLVEVPPGTLLETSNSLLATSLGKGRCLCILDSGAAPYLGDMLQKYFDFWDMDLHIEIIEGGEPCKSVHCLLAIIDRFLSFKLARRSEPVLVIGGGALMDVVGFAASIYRRGVPYFRIPTTLLGYVDAAVGIKTAINYSSHKNLLGSFWPPRMVFLDARLSATESTQQSINGLGEIFKISLIASERLFKRLSLIPTEFCETIEQTEISSCLIDVLRESVSEMVSQLREDLYENCLSRAMDFGHTVSTVLETKPGSQISHGLAVAWDCLLSAAISESRGLLSQQDFITAIKLAKKLGFFNRLPPKFKEKDIDQALDERTAHRDGKQRIPLPVKIGQYKFFNDLSSRDYLDAQSVLISLAHKER